MDFPVSIISRPFIKLLIALQSFFFSRPRLDVDLKLDPNNLSGQKPLGPSNKQNHDGALLPSEVKWDMEYHWNYIIRIRNNSSKTAYGINFEKIYKTNLDFFENIDPLLTLKEGEIVEIKYTIRYRSSKTGNESRITLNNFPMHLNELEILLSYTNEARKKFYTRFIATKDSKTNEHLLKKPKLL